MPSVNPAPRLAWTTPTPALVAVALGGVIMAVAAVFSPDAPSRFLVGAAAVGLLWMAVLGFRQRPRLALVPGDDPHLVVRTLTGPTRYTREQILRARPVYYRRLGRKMPMLEIDVTTDGAERLLIFGRWDLGTHPEEVYHTLRTELNLRGEDVR
ncbi:PH domain-containing protein [Nocardia paucivorans]|uniref:PH domain-containing protein n=1 Tax=Nocardia paucivorans TaxID=114259 RepID=UPI0005934933|nr:PH domain-containing protein [Nocardia paucivorans]